MKCHTASSSQKICTVSSLNCAGQVTARLVRAHAQLALRRSLGTAFPWADRAHTSFSGCKDPVTKRYRASGSGVACNRTKPRTPVILHRRDPPSLLCLRREPVVDLLPHRPRIESCCWEETIHIRLTASITDRVATMRRFSCCKVSCHAADKCKTRRVLG